MERTPSGMRWHIGLFGRRNVGKSSLLNALTGQQVAIVSAQPGTTTDPVTKPMELHPIGPVLFMDTAGVDDTGDLGDLRVRRTRAAMQRTELALLVSDAGRWGDDEEQLLGELETRHIPTLVVFNKQDLGLPSAALQERLAPRTRAVVTVTSTTGAGVDRLRALLVRTAPDAVMVQPTILADLVGPAGCAVLVTPIDREAPRGRLILPQAQAIRDLLDHRAWCVVTQLPELPTVLQRLRQPPDLVVTDSQAFAEVAAVTPPSVPLTSFSIVFARFKGDLAQQVAGTRALDRLRPGDRVLVAEACTHHPIEDDIARIKIPRWLEDRVGGALAFEYARGTDFPEDLSGVEVVIHCGACVFNRRAMLSRLLDCRQAGVPVTNYGLTIAWALGLLPRALEPFPGCAAGWERVP